MAHFIRKVAVKNSAGTTTITAISTIGTDVTSSTTAITISAGGAAGTLIVQATGVSGQTWRWTMHIQGVEIIVGA
jgi:hypothetical protein